MRDSSLNKESFLRSVELVVRKVCSTNKTFRNHVSDISKYLSGEYNIGTRRPWTLKEFISLGIFQWYIPNKELQVLLRLFLEERSSFLSLEDRLILQIILSSKVGCELFLLETSLWHTRDFFGNIVNEKRLGEVLQLIVYRRNSTKVIKPQRHRGYRDHGSCRLVHEQHQPNHDWSYREEQLRLELRRDALHDTVSLALGLIGFGFEGVG